MRTLFCYISSSPQVSRSRHMYQNAVFKSLRLTCLTHNSQFMSTHKRYTVYIYIHNCPGLKDRTTSTHTQCPTSHLEPRSPRRNRLRRILLVNTSKPERCPPTLRMRARRERLFVRAGLNGVSRPRGAMNGEIFRHCPNSSAARHLFPLHGLIRKILIFKHCTSK